MFPSYSIGPGDKALVLREGMEGTEVKGLKNSVYFNGLSFHSTDSHIFSNLFRERAGSGSGISLIQPSMKHQIILHPSINDKKS